MAREILSKRNFFDFESPDSAISRFPMTLMKSMASLHQGPKVSNAKPCDQKVASDSSGLSGGFRGIGRGFGL
jgi:hypothetical protein